MRQDDEETFAKKKAIRGPVQVPDLDQGFRMLKRSAGKQGLPEWMGLKESAPKRKALLLVET